ncbi:unnamed protein product [Cochlearia groenlandica]
MASPPYDNLCVIDVEPIISLQPTQRSEIPTGLILGPAQPIQRGLFRKRAHDRKVLRGESSETRPTQDFIREVINEPQQGDHDFSSPRWTSTIDYMLREGTHNNRTTPLWTQVGEIQCPHSQFVKVKKLVAMLSNSTPNGQGDLLVTLKDPSGVIEGTMHHNIFNYDENRVQTGIGAVVILQNVFVGRFNMMSKYLNITARNIVKIIGVNSMIAGYEPTVAATTDEKKKKEHLVTNMK